MSNDRGLYPNHGDYSQLEKLLKEGRWEEADYETYLVMLSIVDRREGDWIRPDEMKGFPSAALREIDRLWTQYSQGKFGFSIQKQIYETVRNSCQNFDRRAQIESSHQSDLFSNESVEFVKRVGWQVERYKDLIFDLDRSPIGHLPGCWAFRVF
ncbi:MAG TPA: GUN4 domain-containing protein [Oscillatoriales cyanobacterium M59_W2019_021]|nr:MAG: serine/threonine kinase [Cyanobacteria bacterium J055]HIK34017.1 GUN4 domain-containing protein [Oscillatoriales cyanobacterium M4454_W2019_049]HIK51513.1 GUN4 domain-containing protein [Oscillatoriales cyanobacterium M59_W2019_021]